MNAPKTDREAEMESLTYQEHGGRGHDQRPAVQLEGLTKRFGDRTAVNGLSIDVPPGVVAGFVGPNGAGKTTTLRILLGLVRPTSGTGMVLGRSIDDPASYLGRVGGLIEGPTFHPALSGRRNLEVLAALGGLDGEEIPPLLRQVGLGTRGDDPYRTYSLGMKQRLGIAGALLGRPELLLLDEPSNGLDPEGIHEMRDLIGTLSRADRTVLVSSHLLTEVEQVCDWLIMIEEGRLIYQGPTADLMASAITGLAIAPRDRDDLVALRVLLESKGYAVEMAEGRLTVAANGVDATAMAADINRSAMDEGIVLAELSHERAGLEDRYLSMVGGSHD
jgi:ABC-2 type transport system ATP-binding protein